MSSRPDIPSLTGIRFAAAFCILLNHLLLGFFPSGQFPQMAPGLASAGSIGMSLFFVLSGFIIHYNYARFLRPFSLPAFYDFLSARIARLYPLLVAFVLFEYFTEEYILYASPTDQNIHARALSWFLTFSQSWWYRRLSDSVSLTYAFHNSSITWSISTEFLLYLFYPVLLLLFLGDSDSRARRYIKVLAVGAAACGGLWWLRIHPDVIDRWGSGMFGPTVARDLAGQHSFWAWFIFPSPFVRLPEFLLGACCAHLYLEQLQRPQVFIQDRVWGGLMLAAALHVGASIMLPVQFRRGLDDFNATVGYLPSISVLLLGCAFAPTQWVPRLLSSRILVWGGEASYSVYLIHIVLYSRFRANSFVSAEMSAIRAAGTMLLIIFIARALYETLERPARSGARRVLRSLAEYPSRPR